MKKADSLLIADRPSQGPLNAQSKLTERQVTEILIVANSPHRYHGWQKDAAKRYNVTRGQIRHIQTGYRWKYLSDALKSRGVIPETTPERLDKKSWV